MGIPYELLIEFGLEFAARRKWSKPPRPGQVFGTENSAEVWAVKLEKFLEGRFEQHLRNLHDLPQYRNENYRGFHAQDDLRDYLFSELRNTSKPWHMMVQSYCLEHRLIPLTTAMKFVPKEFRSNVISNLKTERDHGRLQGPPNERLPLVSYVPGCFGIPVSKIASDCITCPFHQNCLEISERVSESMLATHRSLSPLKDKRDMVRKEGQRRRTANHRARKAAAQLQSVHSS